MPDKPYDPINHTGLRTGTQTYLMAQNNQEDYFDYESFAQNVTTYDFTTWFQSELNQRHENCCHLSAELGVGRPTVSKWWNGACLPSRENFILLLLHFNTPLEHAQRCLTRLGHYSGLYAKDPADAAAIVLLSLQDPVSALRKSDECNANNSLQTLYRSLVNKCRVWTAYGQEDNNPDRINEALYKLDTDVLLNAYLLPVATRNDWYNLLERYCRTQLSTHRRKYQERLAQFLRQWCGNTLSEGNAEAGRQCNQPTAQLYLDNQWDGARVLHQLDYMVRRRTLPTRDSLILLGLKLGMPAANIDHMLNEGGYAPLGVSDMDTAAGQYGRASALEGALKLALNALLYSFPTLFARWPSAIEMIQQYFAPLAYDTALKQEEKYSELLAKQRQVLNRGLVANLTETALHSSDWLSVNGGRLSNNPAENAFWAQAAVYEMLRGPHNPDGIKTFVRHVILAMELSSDAEALPCWLEVPPEE